MPGHEDGDVAPAYVGGTADREDAVKIVDVLKGKTKQDILTSAGVSRNESTSQGLTAMVYQEEIGLVELAVPGEKSSGARSVPHRCRATVILKDGRVTDMRYESVPEWLGPRTIARRSSRAALNKGGRLVGESDNQGG